MWLIWLVFFAALLSLLAVFAFPAAVPIIAIVALVIVVINAPFAVRAARNRTRDRDDDDSSVRNDRDEVTDLGYRDEERTIPRNQEAIFFGTPEWERHERAERRREHQTQ
jgi:hypothetical protein